MNEECTDYEQWSVEELTTFLKQNNMSERVVQVLSEQRIAGRHLKKINDTFFKNMGLSLGDWLDLSTFLEPMKREKVAKATARLGNPKIFNDPIHGNIYLNPVCLAIIDTPQFQRLRYLKQLGLVYFVYPGAAHNRFEHSLGVCYLAGLYVRTLRDNQGYLGITDQDVLCVEIAALCHDLGHGPFSHTFDQMFIPAVLPGCTWTHEQASKEMFDYLVDENGLNKEGGIFDKYGLTETDLIFIKELISPFSSNSKEWLHQGRPKEKAYLYEEWLHQGRPKEKAYLYEIVANKRNSIDCDKWDYMARDCHQLGIKNNFDHTRFIKFARVNDVNGQLQICLRDKEVLNLYNMFSTRYTLHKIAYQHQVASSMSLMVAHALIKANRHILINGSNGQTCNIAQCIKDMEAYTYLTDNIMFRILDSDSKEEDMKAAKNLIQRLLNRDLYKCVYQSKPIEPNHLNNKTEAMITQDILDIPDNGLSEKDFVVEIVRLDFGMHEENPVERLNVYSKHSPDKARHFPKEEASRIVASNYTELLVRVYSCEQRKDKSKDKEYVEKKFKEITTACEKWFQKSCPVVKVKRSDT